MTPLFSHRRRSVPGLNTTSTADISFMLLILFLVTSSMDVDKGITRQLPPAQTQKQDQAPSQAEQRNVMDIRVMAGGQITVNGQPQPLQQLSLIHI